MSERIELTQEQWMLAKLIADGRMKKSNGHYFVISLKTRCQWCGRSPRAKGKCRAWFQTFLAHLDMLMMNVETELRTDGSLALKEE